MPNKNNSSILDPYRKYSVFVKAFNSKNEGNSSEGIQVMSALFLGLHRIFGRGVSGFDPKRVET